MDTTTTYKAKGNRTVAITELGCCISETYKVSITNKWSTRNTELPDLNHMIEFCIDHIERDYDVDKADRNHIKQRITIFASREIPSFFVDSYLDGADADEHSVVMLRAFSNPILQKGNRYNPVFLARCRVQPKDFNLLDKFFNYVTEPSLENGPHASIKYMTMLQNAAI